MATIAIEITESPEYQRFIGAIHEFETKVFYEGVFKMYFDFTGAKSCKDLLQGSNIDIEDKIIEWITILKKQVRSTTISSRMEVLKLFFEMNRKPLSWKMLERMIPKEKPLKTVGWKREQIDRMLTFAKIREQAVILFFSSTLCRRGALEWKDSEGMSHFLQMKHVIPRNEWNIFEFVIYEGETEEYHTYCDPEARLKFEEYWKFRQEHGETITPESYVFIQEWNLRDPNALKHPEPATIRSIEDAIDRVAQAAGVRTKVKVPKDTANKRSACAKVRHEQKLLHGFRAFGETTLLNAGFSELWLDMIEGHKLKGLRFNYYKPEDDTVLVGTTSSDGKVRLLGYTQLMAELIINNEERAKLEAKNLKDKLTTEGELLQRIEATNKRVESIKSLVEDKIRNANSLEELQEELTVVSSMQGGVGKVRKVRAEPICAECGKLKEHEPLYKDEKGRAVCKGCITKRER